MTASNNKVSTILALFVSILSWMILWLSGLSQTVSAIIGLLILGVLYSLFRVLLFVFIYKNLERIWENIRTSRKNKVLEDAVDQPFNVTWIEEEVNGLLQEKISEIDKLREVERFRRDFLGSVAHELRTPVMSIQGYLETLIDGAVELPEKRDRFLAKAMKNTDGLTAIIEDLITISQIETNQIKIESRNFQLNPLIEEVFDTLENLADKKAVVFRRKGLERAGVNADYQKIKQVLTNLLSNSIKYSKESGGNCTISIFDLKYNILVEVADNGIGIGKDDVHRVFERFYRVDKNRSRTEGGSASTGLGLSIVKHFVEAHGQDIKVKSSLGNGTIFSFTLAKAQ